MGFLLSVICIVLSLTPPVPSPEKADSIAAWCRQGNLCLEEGDGEKAAEYYKKCSDEAGVLNSLIVLTNTLYNLGTIYYDSGDYREALKYIQRSISLGEIVGRTGSFALRFLEASSIYSILGDMEKAEEYARKGLECALKSHNENIIGQLLMKTGELERKKGNISASDSLYAKAVEYFYCMGKGQIFVPRAYEELGKNAMDRGDKAEARHYFERMLESTKFGYQQKLIYDGSKFLEELLREDSPEEAAMYARKLDSLSFVPALDSLYRNIALCNIEFPRKERDLYLLMEKQKSSMLLIIAILLLILCGVLVFMSVKLKNAKAETEKRNVELLHASIQKDKLIALARSASASEEKIKCIEEETSELPIVKLSKREYQVARLCAEGYQNKEIADMMGISPRTVGVHKNNIFKKLGINNTVELLRCLQKLNL